MLHSAGVRSLQATPLFDRGGRVVGVLSTHYRVPRQLADRDRRLVDLLARQAADLIERANAEQSLLEADRAKDEFLAMLGHELRNPLGADQQRGGRAGRSRPAGRRSSASDARDHQAPEPSSSTRLVDDLLDVAPLMAGKMDLERAPRDLAALATPSRRPAADRAPRASAASPSRRSRSRSTAIPRG